MEDSIEIFKDEVPEWLRNSDVYESLDDDTPFLIKRKYIKDNPNFTSIEELKQVLYSSDYWGIDIDLKKVKEFTGDDYNFYTIMSFILSKGEYFCRNVRKTISTHKLGPLFSATANIRNNNLSIVFNHALTNNSFNYTEKENIDKLKIHNISFHIFAAFLRGELDEAIKGLTFLKRRQMEVSSGVVYYRVEDRYGFLSSYIHIDVDLKTIIIKLIELGPTSKYSNVSLYAICRDGKFMLKTADIYYTKYVNTLFYSFNEEEKRHISSEFDNMQKTILHLLKNLEWVHEEDRNISLQIPFLSPEMREINRKRETMDEVIKENEKRRSMSYITALKKTT
jgi:hypothetical protein